jgi:hypothetical protein
MFLWQVEFWLAKNLLVTLHGSRVVYFIRHRKSIIALCDLFPKIHVFMFFLLLLPLSFIVQTVYAMASCNTVFLFILHWFLFEQSNCLDLINIIRYQSRDALPFNKPLPFKTGYITYISECSNINKYRYVLIIGKT